MTIALTIIILFTVIGIETFFYYVFEMNKTGDKADEIAWFVVIGFIGVVLGVLVFYVLNILT